MVRHVSDVYGGANARRCGPCRLGPAARRSRGFTLTELAVTMAIIAVLLGLTLSVVARARQSARNAACLSNLRLIGQAFLNYAMTNGGNLPDPLGAGQRWEDVLLTLLPSRDTFRCDSDDELYPAFASSYDWRDTGEPLTTLAGKRLSEVKRQRAVLAFESLSGWHAPNKMNAVSLDGAARSYEEQECLRDLTLPLNLLDLPLLPPITAIRAPGHDRDPA
jgi:prepilin-type N-terminal cleavage/methylation domain-containing protein